MTCVLLRRLVPLALGSVVLCPTGRGEPAYAGWPNVNRIQNAGFEYKVTAAAFGDIPLYWNRQASSGSGSFEVGRATVRHGMKAVAITDGSGAGAWSLRSDYVPVEPGYVYTLRSWYARADGDGNSLLLGWYDATRKLIGTAVVSSSSATWTLLSLTDTAPSGAAYAAVLLHSSAEAIGTGHFDSVSLVLADQRVPDGGFGDATVGQLPEHWADWKSHTGSMQEAYLEGPFWIWPTLHPGGDIPPRGGNMTLRLIDASAVDSCGAYCTVPVTPDVPYLLSVRAMKPSGVGAAIVRLAFYDVSETELSSHSVSTATPLYSTVHIAAKADPEAVSARLIFSSDAASTGECRFDGVSFAEDYTRMHASPDGAGSMDGSSPENAAPYDDFSFWADVHAAASANPVRVVMVAGDYTRHLDLVGVGNATHHILLEGETPFAVNMADSNSPMDYVLVYGAENLLLRHLHFTSDNTVRREYLLRIGILGYETRDIAVQACSFVGVTNLAYGASGAHRSGTHDITWEYCSGVELGDSVLLHFIYNSWGAHDLWIHHNYIQDLAGYYLKCRDECHDVLIEDNTLISTGTFGPTPNFYLVYFSAWNLSGHDELLPYDIVIRNNSFVYEDPDAPGWENPFVIKMEGDDPSQHPGYYLITTADGEYIADTSNSAESRSARIEQDCHIDLMNGAYQVYGNTYTNCDDTLFGFWRKDPPVGDYWEGIADVDALLGI